MPAAKRASARRSPAKKTSTVKLNKDGTPRKKPGPAPGTPRGQKSGTAKRTTTRGKRGTRAKKSFLLYAVDGNELSFLCESQGATGQIAVQNAVKAGNVDPDTPVVPLAPRAVQRVVEIEAVEREVQYRVKQHTRRRATGTRRAAKPVDPAEPAAETPAPAAKPSARKSARKAAVTPASPAPGEKSANPFAD